MLKLRQALLAAPYVNSSIQILYQINNMHLKTTNTYEKAYMLNDELESEISLCLQRYFATPHAKILHAIKLSENGIITSGTFSNMCYALDEWIYLGEHNDRYRSFALTNLMIEPGKGYILGYQREDYFTTDHDSLDDWINSYGLSDITLSQGLNTTTTKSNQKIAHHPIALCA